MGGVLAPWWLLGQTLISQQSRTVRLIVQFNYVVSGGISSFLARPWPVLSLCFRMAFCVSRWGWMWACHQSLAEATTSHCYDRSDFAWRFRVSAWGGCCLENRAHYTRYIGSHSKSNMVSMARFSLLGSSWVGFFGLPTKPYSQFNCSGSICYVGRVIACWRLLGRILVSQQNRTFSFCSV